MSGLLVDAEAIRALAEILAETGLTEIEVSEKDSRIRVARMPAPVQAVAAAPQAVAAPAPAPAAAPAEAAVPAAPADLSRHPGAVNSPMVGVAYLTPDPSSPPFASEGQIVTAGQTLMLIEAMKTFNQIKAPKGGTLKALLVASGDPVEYGQPLAIIE
ncbi:MULTISPECIES: acetyl-CoA carboxylase biotin carboxyl carrier protein [Acetobacter]|uniref:Biotin carboxyl carrier protein of acetyl-CoA carboxylase n=3 Tax=Acetobacter TaxID=434 RepID=F1YQ85_9PROT|nr:MULTISPECIES: acetyl-CoA carboxylase biotin carboxyl carrier protein [Acetobacter]ASL41370.1 acetyl-CoA carboxylase, biotin carboxyl carrier protein [Acetobacter oryzifermentans]ATI12424.1 acetyl-CoA carboxylase, biotin carboxyl carrier protein [Acetobacter pomorum]AXC27438.1 acetyl-CoA carboxylase biotin carboxyl carrier protein [Acetobacter sp. JWB]AXM99307.1 acetyl-CoA carboxylase, biotin carboxyl carrier protein [Acetobacter pomorum]EGE49082.1 Biotin carboxyl carrier protein of acetyl-C